MSITKRSSQDGRSGSEDGSCRRLRSAARAWRPDGPDGPYAIATLAVLVVSLLMGCGSASDSQPEDAAAFYKGKTITIIVPSSPAGTFDLISRIEAPYIEKYTGARALIRNSTVIQAQNTLYRSKPDGLTVILCGHGPKEIAAQLFNQEGASFDWTKFTLLGRIPASSTAFVVDGRLGWARPADLRGKAFFTGASSPFFAPLFAEALGWEKMVVISGMTGSERALAIRRGELQATTAGAAQVAQDADLLVPIVVTAPDPDGFPGVPTVEELAVEGKEKWGRWASAWDGVLYWSYAPPGIPEDRAAFLEEALEKTYNDGAFAEEMKKLKVNLSAHFIGRSELMEITRTLAELSDADIEQMKFAMTEKYQKH
jgi:tripartite-type tricarboxylate transporter receptor subunit TctC